MTFTAACVSSLRRSPEGKRDFSTLTVWTPAEESSVAGLFLLFPTPASDTQTLSKFDRAALKKKKILTSCQVVTKEEFFHTEKSNCCDSLIPPPCFGCSEDPGSAHTLIYTPHHRHHHTRVMMLTHSQRRSAVCPSFTLVLSVLLSTQDRLGRRTIHMCKGCKLFHLLMKPLQWKSVIIRSQNDRCNWLRSQLSSHPLPVNAGIAAVLSCSDVNTL